MLPCEAARVEGKGEALRYLSCFSGIGGLEASQPPELFCEADESAASVLRQVHPSVDIAPDVQTLKPPKVDVIAGGWPCQDLSVAGLQAGLAGLRSSLLLDMLRVAREAKAHTIVAENVTNLLRMRNGREFSASLSAIADFGFAYIAWRVLNTREFGLPQNRSRLLIIASKDPAVASTLFRKVPPIPKRAISPKARDRAAGFYWTAGTHSINYSRGYVPTIKIGSSLGIASPPAVHYESVVRTLSPSESLRLQGFDIPIEFFSSPSGAYKAAGNAVARPIGRWVLDGLLELESADTPKWAPTQDELFSDKSGQAKYPSAGFWADGVITAVGMERHSVASNLIDFLDLSSSDRLSARASRGLLDRLTRSGQPCPPDLRSLLEDLAA